MWILWCLIFVCWWVWKNWRYLITYWKVGAKYPALPILGHSYLLGGKEKFLQSLYRVGEHAFSNGGHSGLWMLDRLYIVSADAEDVEYILKNHLEKCDMIALLKEFTRTSLLFAPVVLWRPHRKMVSALLSHKNVNKFEPVFVKSSETFVQQLRPLADKGPFSIWKHFSDYTVEATCNTILGIELKDRSTKEQLRNALNSIMDMIFLFLVWTVLHIDGLMKKTRFYKVFTKNDNFVKSCVDEALEKHEKNTLINKDCGKPSDDEEQDSSLLHMFMRLKSQRGIDRSMLHDETIGLLMASSDTTAITSSLIAVVLARKQDVQEKIYQELKEVFGDSDRAVTLEDLPRLKYMEATIKETMRLIPSIPHITRKVVVDTTLPSGLAVPKGTSFLISLYALNRNPKYWGADADQFRPERFLGSDPEQAKLFAFSYGPRGCPGSQYAMMSMKTALATLLRQYRLLPANAGDAPLRLLYGVTVKAIDEFQVRIETRKEIERK